MIDWVSGEIYIPNSVSTSLVHGEWLQAAVKAGTVRVISSNEQLQEFSNERVRERLSIIRTPQFWQRRDDEKKRLWTISSTGESSYCTLLRDVNHDDCTELNEAQADKLIVKRLCNNAALPKRGTEGAAGYDLSAAHDCVIPAKGKGVVKTGLTMTFPSGMYARIAPRSGLAVKKFIDVGAGVVDQDYRGEVGVVLFNHADDDFQVKQGDRIAQLILEKIATPEVQEVQELGDTKRGAGGFGSTGVHDQSSRQKIPSQPVKIQMIVDSQDPEQMVTVQVNVQAGQNPSRVKAVKRLSTSNKPHVLSKTDASRHRDIVSVKTIKKLAKQNVPMFLAVVRQIGQTDRTPTRGKINKSVYCNIQTQGQTEGAKRREMKLKGPKKNLVSVHEKEQ